MLKMSKRYPPTHLSPSHAMIILDDQCYVDSEGFILSLSQHAAEQLTDEEYALYLAGQLEYTLSEIL